MAATSKEMHERTMSLNDAERAELVALLLASLEIDTDDGVEAAWLKEKVEMHGDSVVKTIHCG